MQEIVGEYYRGYQGGYSEFRLQLTYSDIPVNPQSPCHFPLSFSFDSPLVV